MKIQDLSLFSVPRGFRGRSAVAVQIWWLIQATLFRWSPQFLYGWRRWLLRRFGAKIGRGVIIRPSVAVTYPWKLTIGDHSWVGDDVVLYSLGRINIGRNSVVSQQSYICAGDHDYTSRSFPIRARQIEIGQQVWIATGVFVGPGVTVGDGAVIGARSVVVKDVSGWAVYAGNPAKRLRPRPIS